MRHYIELQDTERLDKVVEYFFIAPLSATMTDEEYMRLEKTVTDYCEEEGIDFWADNIHLLINGKEYAKSDKPTPGIQVEENTPYFEPVSRTAYADS